MATRKVLINRHTSGSTAPKPAEMYLGEIAVAHETGKETLFTKNNNNEMVPFISCAQTISIIDDKIKAVNVIYDVKKGENEPHIEVGRSQEGSAVTFTLTSNDIASKAEYEAFSAETKARIDKNVSAITDTLGIISALTDVVVTEISGDTIIVAEPVENGSGSNSYNLTHKQAPAVALGFNKLATDAYGHVTAATPVATADIQGLGFKTSAETDAEIDALSASVVTNKANIEALSAGTKHDITTLSGNVVEYVKVVSGNIETVIQAMDKAADAVAGQVVTTVSEVDGVVSETKANVKDLQLGGYSKDTTATGAIAGTDTINTALSKLENQVGANKITNADGSIVVTEPAGTATTTDVKVNIKSGEKVIKLDGKGGGLYTNLNLVKITESLPATVKERYEFRDSDNNKIGESIDIAKDSHIVSITYNETTQKLIYTYLDASGATQTAEVDMAHLILETEVENGIQSVNGKLSIKLDTTGDDTGDNKFLTVGENGLKLDGVTDAINAAVNGLNYADTAVAGQYVTEVDETNGVISVQRANVSDAVLNGYAKGEKPASTAIAATDDVKGAIAKLEHQVDAAKAAATTKVVKGTDAGNNMTIVPTTGDDNSVTYTVNLTDVASKAALDAEIAARKAVDGQTGQTYAANTGTTYITGATSLNDADVKLDAALKAVSDKVNATKVTEGTSVENYVALALDTATTAGTTALTINDRALKTKIDTIDSAITAETKAREDAIKALDSVGSASTTGHYLTSVTITDGKISAVGEEALPAATPVTTVNGTTGTTVAPVLTGIVTGGTEGHKLTLNYTNKVLSAQTADEAAHASAATKVDQKLTFADDANDVEYDGSEAQTITFGTAVSSTGITGRSMSITNGVVDVEIIDCGEY